VQSYVNQTGLASGSNIQSNCFALVERHFRSKSNWKLPTWTDYLSHFSNHKRRGVLGNVWTHDQLSVLWRNIWKEPGFTSEEPEQSYPKIPFTVNLKCVDWECKLFFM